MAYWDVLYDICDELQNGTYVEQDGTYGGNVLVIESSSDEDEIGNRLKQYFEENGIDTSEVRRPDDPSSWIDFATDDHWTYYDEGFICDNCGKFYYNDDFFRNWYWSEHAGGIYCIDCFKDDESLKEDYIADLINNPKSANTLLDDDELEDMGFQKYNDSKYSAGMYGRFDSPEDVIERVLNDYPDASVIFSIDTSYRNPFETDYDVWFDNDTYYDIIDDDDYDDEPLDESFKPRVAFSVPFAEGCNRRKKKKKEIVTDTCSSKEKCGSKKKSKNESKNLNEDTYLNPGRYDSRRSFYKKAKVRDYGNGVYELISYTTPVAMVDNGEVIYADIHDWSRTTDRHIREFLAQYADNCSRQIFDKGLAKPRDFNRSDYANRTQYDIIDLDYDGE